MNTAVKRISKYSTAITTPLPEKSRKGSMTNTVWNGPQKKRIEIKSEAGELSV